MSRTAPVSFQSTPPVKAATVDSGSPFADCSFQSTPPVKAATLGVTIIELLPSISIHAAREGGDGFGFCPCRRAERFQSTPPVKAATNFGLQFVKFRKFQSTPPVKAATCPIQVFSPNVRISIHAAREGGDYTLISCSLPSDNFNPRRP